MWSSRTLALGCLLSCAACAEGVRGTQAVEVSDFREIYSHRSDPRRVEVRTPWADVSHDKGGGIWEFQLTVDEQGRVVAAVPRSGPIAQRDEATRTAMALRFEPFTRDGHVVRARFRYYVPAVPDDYSGPLDRGFPASSPPEATVIALRRTSCFGTCPDYRVEVRGSGEVVYRGNSFVLVTGEHRWRITPDAVAGLLDLFRRADYFRLAGYYELNATDLPTYITRLSLGSQHKFVLDYGGGGMGGAFASTSFGGDDPHMPPVVTELEKAVDRISGAASWTSGDENTLARLRAAKLNFRSKQVRGALGLLIGDCRTELARQFILEGAPLAARGEEEGVSQAIVGATGCADVGLVQLMESKGVLASRKVAEAFLEASVASGYPDMVAIALRHSPDARMKNADGIPLISTAASAHVRRHTAPGDAEFDPARVITLLLASGADANSRDEDGNVPLHEASSAAVARALIKGGADPHARNANGRTPLFNPYFEEPKVVLLEAGVDVTLRDKLGRTALFEQQYAASANALIKAGADVNAKDLEGWTPLETARREEVALALLAAGARLPADPERLRKMIMTATEAQWTKLLPTLESAANAGAGESARSR